ncbi:hypothetical protein C8R47DRAFT_1288246 [Mycena vitilis]|nr:hypothetical protein C8R47DRAFT_1288246 [Mycena vitilis]
MSLVCAQGQVFRVFVAILKAKSSVIADMFTFPQPSAVAPDIETMEGVPVVTLHDDPTEVEVFLKAIFDSDKLEDTLGILRLAHKYDVPYLRRRALNHLATTNPTQLSEYSQMPPTTTAQLNLGKLVMIISTATEVGALWLLPVADYKACQFELSMILQHKGWHTLGELERQACVLGYEAIFRQYPRILEFILLWKREGDDCENPTACNRRRSTLSGVHTALIPCMNTPLAMFEMEEEDWLALFEGVCRKCVQEARTHHATSRQKVWDMLPAMFGLLRWEELEQMREAAFSSCILVPGPSHLPTSRVI